MDADTNASKLQTYASDSDSNVSTADGSQVNFGNNSEFDNNNYSYNYDGVADMGEVAKYGGYVDKNLYNGAGDLMDDPNDIINYDDTMNEEQRNHIQFAQTALAADGIL